MAGIDRHDIGFTVSGSCDYLAGQAFAFVQTIEAIGAWPPISESHVEMDGAWAMYEGFTRLQEGDIDLVLVYSHGRSSPGKPEQIYPLQLDPYHLAPLGLDPWSLAALQARALLDAGTATERDFAEIVARNRANAVGNEYAQVSGKFDVDALLAEPLRARAAAPSRPPADLRRRGRGRARRRRQGGVAGRPAGVDHRHRPPHRHPPARHARPHRVAVDHARGRGRRARLGPGARSPSSPRRSRRRRSWCATRSASATAWRSTRRAARSPPTR